MINIFKSLRKDVLAMFLGSFLLLFSAQAVFYWSTQQADESKATATRATLIDLNLENLLSNAKDIETGLRGFILTRNPDFLEPYNQGIPKARKNLETLAELIKDPEQKNYLVRLDQLTNQRIQIAENIIKLQRNKGITLATQAIREGKGRVVMDQLRDHVHKMLVREAFILKESTDKAEMATSFTRSVNIVTFFIALMMQLAAFYLLIQEMIQRRDAEMRVQEMNQTLNDQLELLNESNTALNAVNKELETFAYSVSHDLRSPLRGIDGFSLALLEDYGNKIDDTGKSYLERVRSESQRMGLLIDGILSLSRLTRGDVSKTDVNLSNTAEKILSQLKQQSPDRNVHYKVQPAVTAQADPRLIEPVLENLLNNAWKFTSKKPLAEIEFGSIQKDGKDVYFVKDNGAGFDMAYANKLFGPFQRLHGMTEFEGTGIGLATVQRIVNRHGGIIWTEAALDKGATFYFSLN